MTSELEEKILNLFTNDSASHAYIFFGDNQVGKFTFALKLANFLETNKFEKPAMPLIETLVIKPTLEETKSSIGIDEIREIKNFLYQTPVNSKYRLAIIDDAHYLTEYAESAILKIAEEPPSSGIILMVLPNPETLMKTIQSRFQKIYFPRYSSDEITKTLVKNHGLSENKAKEISALSYGRIGRAISLIEDKDFIEIDKSVEDLIRQKIDSKETAKYLAEMENRAKIDPFMENLLARLALDPIKNFNALKALSKRLNIMSTTSANKRLQLEAGLYTVSRS